jgi:hypothetical protein
LDAGFRASFGDRTHLPAEGKLAVDIVDITAQRATAELVTCQVQQRVPRSVAFCLNKGVHCYLFASSAPWVVSPRAASAGCENGGRV